MADTSAATKRANMDRIETGRAAHLSAKDSLRIARMKALALVPLLLFALAAEASPPLEPSRPPAERCQWEGFADPALGLETLVQRCAYGVRKIDFVRAGDAL